MLCQLSIKLFIYPAIYLPNYLSILTRFQIGFKFCPNGLYWGLTFYSLLMLANTLSGQARQWTFPGSPRSPWRTCGWRCWAWWAGPPATPCSSDSQPTSYSPSTHPGANTGLPSEDFWEVFDQFLLGPVGRVKIMKHQKDHEVNSYGLSIQFSFWRLPCSLTVKKLFLRLS